jgi:hypothetical protein
MYYISKTFGCSNWWRNPNFLKRIFNKNLQHHLSLLGCIICPWNYPHGPIVHGCKHDQKSQIHQGLGMFSKVELNHISHISLWIFLFFSFIFLQSYWFVFINEFQLDKIQRAYTNYYYLHKMNRFSMKSIHPKIVYW